MPGPRSFLTVAATPHVRPSTRVLQVILAELEVRSDTTSTLWFLREGHQGDAGSAFPAASGGKWVVDALRTTGAAAWASRSGLEPVAGALRGRRLRARLREVGPDAVLLDDGFGERILGPDQADVPRFVRLNGDESITAAMEQLTDGRVDAWLVPPGGDARATGAGRVIEVSPLLDDFSRARPFGTPAAQAELRARAGLPADGLVVVGWGGGGWIDGADLFLRALWALGDRHGIEAHGLWVGHEVSTDDAARLATEAVRCGVAERFHLVDDDPDLQLCGDVALLPYRCQGDRTVLEAVCAGMAVVGFEALGLVEDAIELVPDLDVDAAAAAVAAAPLAGRAERVASARRRIDVAALVDELLEVIDASSGR